jgi:hypothetical protein
MLRVARRFSSGPLSIYTSLLNEEPNFTREQRFMRFCKQIEKLYDMHSEQQAAKIKRDHTFRLTAFSSEKPLRDAFTAYAQYRDCWDSEHIAATSQWVGQIAQSRGPRVYFDFTNTELFQSWQFIKYLEDVKFGLKKDIEFPSTHLASVAMSLGNMKYKDSELTTMLMDKLKAELAGNVAYTGTEPNHKYHVYTGFVNNPTFQEYLQTLYLWKSPKSFGKPKTKIEWLIQDLAHKVHYIKGIQNDLASSVFNLPGYYYDIKKAVQDEPNLLHNHYLKQAILELEEILVGAGLIHPDEMIDLSLIEDIDLRMERAEELFKELVQTSFRYLSSPTIEKLYKATEDFGKISLPDETAPLPNPNAVNGELISRVVYYLSQIMRSTMPDKQGEDYPNNSWKKEAFNSQNIDKGNWEKERLIIKPEFTNAWIHGQKYLKELVPDVMARLDSFEIDSLCLLAYGYSRASVVDSEMFSQIAKNVVQHLEGCDPNILAKGLYGLNLAGEFNQASVHLANLLNSHGDVDRLSDTELCEALWGLCSSNQYSSPTFNKLLDNLNRQNISQDFLNDNSTLLNDIRAALEIEGPGISALSQSVQDAFAVSRQFQFLPSLDVTYDPVKPLVVPSVRGMMGQEISQEEASILHAQLQAKVDPETLPFRFDDLLVFNGKIIPVFVEGYEGFSQDSKVLGNIRMRIRLMKKLGFSPLALPIYELVDLNYENGKMKFREGNRVMDIFQEAAGTFRNFLEPSNTVVEKLIKYLRNQELKNSKVDPQLFILLKQILTLYKIQSISKLTPDQPSFNQSLEDLKIQLLRLKCSYEDLKPANQQLINLMTSNYSSFPTFPDLLKSINESILIEPSEPIFQPWMGTRLSVELLDCGKKDITPELINQNFLWLENYHHYKDWEIILNTSYPLAVDMLIETEALSNRFFFGARRQQEGILPKSLDHNSLKLSIPAEARLIANLQNIKYQLKRSLTDNEILSKVLNLEILDKLIDEHLTNPPAAEAPKLLNRDPQSYIQFKMDQDRVMLDSDPYINFYKKLYAEKQISHDVYDRLMSAIKELNEMDWLSPPDRHLAKLRLIHKYIETQKQIEKDSFKRDDIWNNLKQELKIKTDENILFSTQPEPIEDSDLLNAQNSEEYLRRKRLKSESTLIKARILYKLHNDTALSSNETAYLKLWMEDLSHASLTNTSSTLVRNKLTNLKIVDLPESDTKTFESLHGVSISNSEKDFSANELLLELSNFIDEETIKNFELRIKEKEELSGWGVSADSSSFSKLIPNYRNKEITLANRHIEEYLWRKSGHLTDSEIDQFWNLYKFKVDKSVRGQALLALDKANFLEFLQEANKHDDRLKFIASWYRKKEEDNKTRGYDQHEFNISDSALQHGHQEKINQVARKALEAYADMSWDKITSGALIQFIRKFRATVTTQEVIEDKLLQLRGILIHPRLPPNDKLELMKLINHYKIEVMHEDPEDSLSERPIKLIGDKLDQELNVEAMQEMLKNARADYLNSLVSKVERLTKA